MAGRGLKSPKEKPEAAKRKNPSRAKGGERTNAAYPDELKATVLTEWRWQIYELHQLASRHKVPVQTIHSWIKAAGIVRVSTQDRMRAIDEALTAIECAGSGGLDEETAKRIAGAKGAAVIGSHRERLAGLEYTLRKLGSRILSEIENIDTIEDILHVGLQKAEAEESAAERERIRWALAHCQNGSLAKALRDLTEVHAKLIGLERQAFSLPAVVDQSGAPQQQKGYIIVPAKEASEPPGAKDGT